jgi:methyl-accepting chemotaxis protein PixJ
MTSKDFDFGIFLQDFEQPEQILNSQSQFERSLSYGDGEKTRLNGSLDLHEAFDLVAAIKADLEQEGHSVNPEAQQKVLQLEKWVEQLQTKWKDNFEFATEQQYKHERQSLLSIINKIQQSANIDTLVKTTVTEVRKLLKADRVVIYRFQSEKHGIVLAEAMGAGYTPASGEYLPAIIFGFENQLDYKQQHIITLNYEYALSIYQLQLLKQFQIKAGLSLPILIEGQVWGLLAIHQCSDVRKWQEAELSLLSQIVAELKLNLQTIELHNQRNEEVKQEKVLTQILQQIPPSSDPSVTLANITEKLRQFYKADRVTIYRFYPDWSGEFIAESVGAGWISLLNEQEQDSSLNSENIVLSDRCTVKLLGNPSARTTDCYLKDTQGGSFVRGKGIKRVDDIHNAGFSNCYLETLEKYQTKAYIIAPIFEGEQLWGLLGVSQNSAPRRWQDSEAALLSLTSRRLSTILKQAESVAQLQQKSEQLAAERERAVAKVIDRIRQSSDINNIFKITTQEVRSLLKAERVVIYRFEEDWSGEFVAESVASGWTSLLQEQIDNPLLRDNISECSIKTLGGGQARVSDTYLQRTQGGNFATQANFRVVDDIYQAGFSACYLDILERYQARAYVITPIIKGEKGFASNVSKLSSASLGRSRNYGAGQNCQSIGNDATASGISQTTPRKVRSNCQNI